MAVLSQADGLFFYLGWPTHQSSRSAQSDRASEPGQHPPGNAGLGHRRPEQHARLRREGPRQVQPDARRLLLGRLLLQRRLGLRELRRHALHDDLPDESVRPDQRRPQPQRRLLLQLRQSGRQLLHRRLELPPRRLQLRLRRRLGAVPQGDDQRLAVQSRQRRADERELQFDDLPLLRPRPPRASTRHSPPAGAARSSAPINIEFCHMLC